MTVQCFICRINTFFNSRKALCLFLTICRSVGHLCLVTQPARPSLSSSKSKASFDVVVVVIVVQSPTNVKRSENKWPDRQSVYTYIYSLFLDLIISFDGFYITNGFFSLSFVRSFVGSSHAHAIKKIGPKKKASSSFAWRASDSKQLFRYRSRINFFSSVRKNFSLQFNFFLYSYERWRVLIKLSGTHTHEMFLLLSFLVYSSSYSRSFVLRP